MYRQTDDRKVWYEWMVEVYALERTTPTAAWLASPVSPAGRSGSPGTDTLKGKDPVARPQGSGSSQPGFRRVRVGMSEFHSSIKEGCLM